MNELINKNRIEYYYLLIDLRRSIRRPQNVDKDYNSSRCEETDKSKFRFDERSSVLYPSSENSFKESDSSSTNVDRTKIKPQPKNVANSLAFVETVASSQCIGLVGDTASSNPDITRLTFKEKKRMECAESGQLKSMPSTSDHETTFSSKKRLSQ